MNHWNFAKLFVLFPSQVKPLAKNFYDNIFFQKFFVCFFFNRLPFPGYSQLSLDLLTAK